MQNQERFKYLLDLYVSGSLSAGEHDEFLDLVNTHDYDGLLGQHILRDLEAGEHKNSADLPPHIAQEIIRNIYQAEKNTNQILPPRRTISIGRRWMAAASIILLLVTASLFFLLNNREDKDSFASFIPRNTLVHSNPGSMPKTVALEDGSIVTLQPGSSLHYPKAFASDKREVYLEGEAFFEVAKNPRQPFLVYYNDIVTKVLGTSFTINTNSKTGNIEVAVSTGKVQVYENEHLSKDKNTGIAVIVAPNQKAIYKKRNRLFETTLVDKPQAIATGDDGDHDPASRPAYSFIFEQEKLLNVFRQIEKSYGIEIVAENAAINDCVFTGDVSTNDLYTKLKIICLTVNASYEINGTRILIKGQGCN